MMSCQNQCLQTTQVLLLNKLDRYGIRNKTHTWISNFLKYRKQRVVIGGEHSTWTQVMSGVPQGTVLGPLLFLTYINDLPNNIHSSIRLFADDCVLSSSSSLGSRCVPWLGEGLSMLSPNYPVLCFPLPYRVAPVFVQVVSPSLGWSPLSSFLVIWSPTGDTRGPSVVFEAVDMPCPGPFHFSYSVDYIYDF